MFDFSQISWNELELEAARVKANEKKKLLLNAARFQDMLSKYKLWTTEAMYHYPQPVNTFWRN